DHGPADVLGLVGRAGHAQLLELDLKAAFLADPLAARQPDAGTDAARDHGADGLRLGILAEERDRHAGAGVEIADEAEASAAAHEIHDGARRPLVVAVVADVAAAE